MGGGQSFNIGLTNLDKFAYIGPIQRLQTLIQMRGFFLTEEKLQGRIETALYCLRNQ